MTGGQRGERGWLRASGLGYLCGVLRHPVHGAALCGALRGDVLGGVKRGIVLLCALDHLLGRGTLWGLKCVLLMCILHVGQDAL